MKFLYNILRFYLTKNGEMLVYIRPWSVDLYGPVIIYGRGGQWSEKWGGVENILRFKE